MQQNEVITIKFSDPRVGRHYAGVNLPRGSTAVLANPIGIFGHFGLKLKMMVYSATHGVIIKVCYDSGFSNCEILFPEDDGYTQPVYAQWREWTATRNLPFWGKSVFNMTKNTLR